MNRIEIHILPRLEPVPTLAGMNRSGGKGRLHTMKMKTALPTLSLALVATTAHADFEIMGGYRYDGASFLASASYLQKWKPTMEGRAGGGITIHEDDCLFFTAQYTLMFGHYSPFSWENTSWFIGPVVGVGSVHDKLTPMYGGIVQWRFLSASLTNSGVLAGFNF